MTHTLVRVAGYGKQVLLDPPSSMKFCADGTLELRRDSRLQLIHPVDAISDESDTFDPCPEADPDCWQVETSLFRHQTVDNFTVVTQRGASPSPYDLICGRTLVYLQGPFSLASLRSIDALVAQGERELQRDATGVRVQYTVDGERWFASRSLFVARNCYSVLSAQAPDSEVSTMDTAVAKIRASFSWT